MKREQQHQGGDESGAHLVLAGLPVVVLVGLGGHLGAMGQGTYMSARGEKKKTERREMRDNQRSSYPME